jgi:hypothetical protein
VTARWVVDEVQTERDLNIRWRPISLLLKNQPPKDSEYYDASMATHRMLRVMESVRKAEGDGPIQDLYWEFGRRIHHDKDRTFDISEALAAVGLDTSHAAAADDESWDEVITDDMDEGLALTGTNVGTPLLGFTDKHGLPKGIFGPVITRVPSGEESLQLWDAMVTMATMDGFWELKRTRTEAPEFGDRP